ncbi:MAG TPA: ADP-ribosylation factor-directed GTPase activating protein isoform b [Planctomycetaceae bacterium]|nr:ADP-ribosylation factor-directed GTPase activating protein isoform b [Planctomycetaceae bacterium]
MSIIRQAIVRQIAPLGLLPLVILMIGCPTSRVDDSAVTLIATGVLPRIDDSGDAIHPVLTVTADQSATDAVHLRVNETLKTNLQGRRLATEVNAAWQVMHGVLAYGRDFSLTTASGPQPAVTYILGGGPIKGFLLRGGDKFEIDGRTVRGVVAELEPGQKIGQGHRDQWVAYMARCELKPSDVVSTTDGPLTVEGWIRQIEWDVPRNFEGEYSWTLTALLAHRPTTHRWKSRDGSEYSIESLLESEVGQLSPTSACGGSHRLCAIASAVNRHRNAGQPITGVWADAEMVVEMAIEQSRDFQNADGSFSSHYFERPGWSPDLVAMLGTSGHVFEFLAVAGSDEMLREPWMEKAALSLCEVLERTAHIDLECGALYHALSGLSIYEQRIRETPQTAFTPTGS